VNANAYIIAGPNGACKRTFNREFLPKYARCREFLNADLLAAGISPFDPDSAAIAAGRIVLTRMKELIRLSRSIEEHSR
jgi:predicted ABC-type ATPase